MKIRFIIFIFTIITTNLSAQNLVPDGGLEDYDSCPKGVNLANGLNLKDWFVPTGGTADYLNVCNNTLNGVVGIPSNTWGYQNTFGSEGNNGYCGMWKMFGSDYTEYISSKLISPLVPGNYYRVSMIVSLAGGLSRMACDGLGAIFMIDTLDPSYKAWSRTLPYSAQINYSSYGIISDTTNWITLTNTFLADSAYNYIIVGNVTPSQNLNRIKINQGIDSNIAYYYVDNIRVEHVFSTSVSDLTVSSISFAPNPINDRSILSMQNYNGQPYSISLVNTIGQVVWQRNNVTDKELIFEPKSLPSGIYYYQLIIKGQSMQKGKLMIE